MAHVTVSCPYCGAKLKMRPGMEGRRARCRACRQSMQLPAVLPEATPDLGLPPGEERVPELLPTDPLPVPSLDIARPLKRLTGNRSPALWIGIALVVGFGVGCCGGFAIGYRTGQSAQGAGPVSLAAYKVRRPMQPRTFTLECALTHDHYTEEWRDTHVCVEMRDPKADEKLFGTADRNSPAGKRLAEVLADGDEHRLTVRVRFDDAVDPTHWGVLVLDVVGP
jgi:hypothetical protein